MKTSTTTLLFVTVLIVGLYIQFGERHRDNLEQRKAAARLALKFEPESIVGLRIETPDGLFILEASNRTWRIVSPVQGMADANNVLRILDTLAGLRRSEIITTEEQKALKLNLDTYGLITPRAKITIDDGITQSTVLIGRDAPGGQQLYMKRNDMDDILVTSRDVLATLPATVLDLRDRKLFSSQPGRIRRLDIDAGGKSFSASRNEEDQWNIERPVFARGANSNIRQWLDHLYEFRIQDFVADSMAAGSLYGFDEPTAQVSLATDNRSTPQVLKIGRPADINNTLYYATLLGQEAVFSVASEVVDWLLTDTAEFRDNRAMAIPVVNINYIQMSEGELSLQLARNTQDVWEVISPKRFPADDRKVQRILSAWSGAKVDSFIDPPIADPDTYGVDKSKKAIMFSRTVRNGTASPAVVTNQLPIVAAEQQVTLVVGNTSPAGTLYTSPADQPYIMEISGSLTDAFTVNPLDFRDHLVLTVVPENIRRITQRIGEQELSVIRTNILFRSTLDRQVSNTDNVDRIISTVSRMSAFRFIEEDPRDLNQYGLLQPARQLILGLSGADGINRVLLFGGPAGDDETFVMIQGTDVVFTLRNDVINLLFKPVINPTEPIAPTERE
jgi:hypothetical protein